MAPDVEGATKISQCLACPEGTYQPLSIASGEENCLPCAPGKWSSVIGAPTSATCQGCPLGTWSDEEGLSTASQCKPCPIGTYGVRSGGFSVETSCAGCPPGFFGVAEGATSIQQCSACPPGTRNSASGASSQVSCGACEPGSFSNGGASGCELCGAGKYTASGGAERCDPCPVGTFAPNRGATTCLPCEIGKYGAELGSTACVACSMDRTTRAEGTTGILDCHCAAGLYAASDAVPAGGLTCLPCAQPGMACDIGRMPGVAPGFWHHPVVGFEVIFPCEPSAACIGGNLFGNTTARCALTVLVNDTKAAHGSACHGAVKEDALAMLVGWSAGRRQTRCAQQGTKESVVASV